MITWVLSSLERKPKWDKNKRAVWNSWQSVGGVHSVPGSEWSCTEYSSLSATACLSNNLRNSLTSPLLSSSNNDSNSGIDLSLKKKKKQISKEKQYIKKILKQQLYAMIKRNNNNIED